MKVFLDTNVLASAAATRGLCADVLREVLSFHQLVVSPLLFEELKRVLIDKFGVSKDSAAELLELLREDSIPARAGEARDIQIKDRDDVLILSSALNGGADVFVTGDKELLRLGEVGGLEIISPRDFWERIRSCG